MSPRGNQNGRRAYQNKGDETRFCIPDSCVFFFYVSLYFYPTVPILKLFSNSYLQNTQFFKLAGGVRNLTCDGEYAGMFYSSSFPMLELAFFSLLLIRCVPFHYPGRTTPFLSAMGNFTYPLISSLGWAQCYGVKSVFLSCSFWLFRESTSSFLPRFLTGF